MKKKKIIIIIAVLLIAVAAGVGIFIATENSGYKKDATDTEELYRQNISEVGYKNTIETAIPQTDIYTIIDDHFRSPLAKGKTVKKAILIGYDGCRADILAEIQDGESGIKALTDNGAALNLVYCGGVNYPEKNTQDTSTAPGWCSILTGEWADIHGITGNDITKAMDTKTLFTSLTEEKIIGSASFITKWAGHFSRRNATYLAEKDYCETNNLPVSFVKCKNDEASFNYTMEEIGKDECSDFIFSILEPTDATGHGKGFTYNNPEYKDAFKLEDSYAHQLITAMKNRSTFAEEEWLVIITSDHGGIGTNHGKASIQERMTFVVADYF